ncbi:MAG TPA: hypothetical protein VHB27_09260 [Rhodopila sp.]|uniref:hypothetical protein n=1 Tax=Rhodopila sp. TaxID=2480087 RepID=UPI002CEAFA8F|nr:hypothetical protein [Rhodopila sp.]HVY15405.1 hypothetical protein [Rhodopila sp.]
MKTILRMGFATLIVLTLLIQATRGQRGDADADPRDALVSELQRMDIATRASTQEGTIDGQAPHCARPLHAMLLRIDGADDERLKGLDPEADQIRYIYNGIVSDRRDWAGVMARSALGSASFVLGLRSSRPRPDLVVVSLPRACPGLATLDWARLSPAG